MAAGDDGAGVAHAAARRGGLASDEGHHRLGDVRLHEFSGLLLSAAADLANHDDGVGVWVILEHPQCVNVAGAVDRIAAELAAYHLDVSEHANAELADLKEIIADVRHMMAELDIMKKSAKKASPKKQQTC